MAAAQTWMYNHSRQPAFLSLRPGCLTRHAKVGVILVLENASTLHTFALKSLAKKMPFISSRENPELTVLVYTGTSCFNQHLRSNRGWYILSEPYLILNTSRVIWIHLFGVSMAWGLIDLWDRQLASKTCLCLELLGTTLSELLNSAVLKCSPL